MVHRSDLSEEFRGDSTNTMNIQLSNDNVECDRFEMGVPNSKSSETTKTKAKQPC